MLSKYTRIWGAFAICRDLLSTSSAQGARLSSQTSVDSLSLSLSLSHCQYTRYNEQYADVQAIMHAIVNVCLAARAAFNDKEEVFRLWRYMNLLHICAYCGLTDELSRDNFLVPLSDKHGLLFGEMRVMPNEVTHEAECSLNAAIVRRG